MILLQCKSTTSLLHLKPSLASYLNQSPSPHQSPQDSMQSSPCLHEHLSPTLSFLSLSASATRPPCCALNVPTKFPAQGLCTCQFLCLSLPDTHIGLVACLLTSAETYPLQPGLPYLHLTLSCCLPCCYTHCLPTECLPHRTVSLSSLKTLSVCSPSLARCLDQCATCSQGSKCTC